MELSGFLERYPPRGPRRAAVNADELRRLDGKDGVCRLTRSPAEAKVTAVPDRKGDTGCHLWVIDASGIPYILEHAGVAGELESGVVKHTNLTGGEPASCGGELWVDPVDDGRLYINGCSGRYGPETEEQLADAVAVVGVLGFEVVSFGWDDEAARPAMVLRS